MRKSILFLLIILVIPFALAELRIFGGEEIDKVIDLTTEVQGGGGGSGSNVTSVTSSTNCIVVSPTTGDVILTFNTSCASAGAVSSVDEGDNFLIVDPTTGDVIITQNQTTLNATIFSISSQFNETTLILNTNSTLWTYIFNNEPSWLSTFNSTYALFAYNQTDTFQNPFNQNLNTTSNVTFNHITATGNVTSSGWFNGLFNWVVESLSSYLLPSFNGTALIINFNETILNTTIDSRSIGDYTNIALTNQSNNFTTGIQDVNSLRINGNVVGDKEVYQCGLSTTTTSSFFQQDGAVMSGSSGIVAKTNGSIVGVGIHYDIGTITANGTIRIQTRINNTVQNQLNMDRVLTVLSTSTEYTNVTTVNRNLINFRKDNLIQCSILFQGGAGVTINNMFGWVEVQYNE